MEIDPVGPQHTEAHGMPTAVILAAGEGMRIRPISLDVPKAALPVGNRALILHHLDALRDGGVEDVVIVIGATGDALRAIVDADPASRALRVRYVEQTERRGIAHALLCAEPHIPGAFILTLADIYLVDHRLDRALAEFRTHRCAAVLGARDEPDPEMMRRNFSIAVDANGAVARVIEKPSDPRPGLKGIGTYIFDRAIFDAIRATPPSALRGEQELTDAVQTLIDRAGCVRASLVTEKDINVNDPADLIAANLAFLHGRGLTTALAPGATVDASAVLENVVVGPGAVIEADAHLRDCVVLPGTRISAGARLHRCVMTPDHIVHADAPDGLPTPPAIASPSPPVSGVVCPRCRAPLRFDAPTLECTACGHRYDLDDGFPDLIVGDRFPDALSDDALEYEERHCCHTTRRYWAPLFRRVLERSPTPPRILALGCGVGVEVDILCETGFDCIGIDNGNRVARWQQRTEKTRLILANGMHLPFADATFDAVFCGCVFPHVGVVGDTFQTTPTFTEERTRLAVEIGRVLRPGGRVFAASPNRLFPLDIFHGRESGSLRPRLNPPTDPFLLSVGDYRGLFRAGGCVHTRPLPPRGYWMFDRSRRSLRGRAAALPVRALFGMASIPGATILHGSPLTPWIVVSATKAR